jgi:hypothetical protein
MVNKDPLMTHYLKLSFFTLMFVVPTVSHASIVFTNFGASFAYNTTGGNIVGNDLAGDQLAQADTFTPAANATLSSIEIALSCFTVGAGGCPVSITVSLDSDSGADSPGATLESFTVAGPFGGLGSNNAPVVLTSVLHPTLVSGTQYWLAVIAPLTTEMGWNWNSTGDVSDQAVSTDGGVTWFSPSGETPGAYEIDGTSAVPEPGTILLLATGGALIALKRKLS